MRKYEDDCAGFSILERVDDSPEQKRILCYGDSNTWGYRPIMGTRYDSETRWPARLGKLTGFEIAEEGLNGRTTIFYDADEQYRCGLDYVETCVMSQLPLDLIIVMLGSNDTKIRYHASPEETADGLSRMIDKMRECCARKEQDPQILILSPPKLYAVGEDSDFDSFSEQKIVEMEVLFEKLAAEKDCLFLRTSDVLTDIGADGLHMTPEGHRKLAEAAAKTACRILR